jgi:hypothetical protein
MVVVVVVVVLVVQVVLVVVKNQSHYRPEVPRRFQEVKVPRLRENDTGWW